MTPMQIVRTVVGPLIGPLATAGIVIVFVIFMLLKREDLRDRLIRLAGVRDLPRTTQALDDAAQRVGRYLLMQLVVNVTYGIPDRRRALADRRAQPGAVGHARHRAALRPLYRPGHRGRVPAGARHRRRSGLDHAALDRRALRRHRTDQQQCDRAVALRRQAPDCRRSPSSPRRSSGPGCGARRTAPCRRR